METLSIMNPFPGAASFHIVETTSTMDEARHLARLGLPPGTVIAADRQHAGRGRLPGRNWEAPPEEALLATLILGGATTSLPGLPLRIGLAIARALTIMAIRLGYCCVELPELKWPNDVLIGDKKLVGILCEAAENRVFVGFGLNLNQRSFPPELAGKATSLALAAGLGPDETIDRFAVLELALEQIFLVLAEEGWREEAEMILWRRGEEVGFLSGIPEDGNTYRGRLEGLGADGSLLLRLGATSAPRAFLAGELLPREAASRR